MKTFGGDFPNRLSACLHFPRDGGQAAVWGEAIGDVPLGRSFRALPRHFDLP